jgi:hypothetical protein
MEQITFYSDFLIGDKVRYGPHEALVGRIYLSKSSVMYELYYFHEGEPKSATAWDFELSLLERKVDA